MHLCAILKEVLNRMECVERQLTELRDTVSTMDNGAVTINWGGADDSDDSDDEMSSEGAQSAPW